MYEGLNAVQYKEVFFSLLCKDLYIYCILSSVLRLS